MADPLNPKVDGDLAALGISDRNDPGAEIYGDLEEEAQATAAEETEAPEPQEEVQTPEPEKAEDPEEKPLLAQLEDLGQPEQTASEESEIDRLRREKIELEAALRERRRIAEDEIRNAVPKEEPKEDTEPYLNSPVVQQTLRAIRDENPEQYEQTLIELAKAEMLREVEAKEQALIARLEKAEMSAQEAQQRDTVKQGINSALTTMRAEGGLMTELVEEFEANGMNSHIGRKMQEAPQMFYSPQGTEDAVRSLESKLRSKIAHAQRPESRAVVQGAAVSAGTGGASTRGIDMDVEPNQKTPEEEYVDRMFNTSRSNKLEFFG
jgi:hypothetical protein